MDKQVTVIKKDKNAVLIECVLDGELVRRVIPPDALSQSREVDEDAIRSGIDYGVDWSSVLPDPPVMSKEEFAGLLKQVGIWTWLDMRLHPARLIGAVNAFFKNYISDVLKGVKSNG